MLLIIFFIIICKSTISQILRAFCINHYSKTSSINMLMQNILLTLNQCCILEKIAQFHIVLKCNIFQLNANIINTKSFITFFLKKLFLHLIATKLTKYFRLLLRFKIVNYQKSIIEYVTKMIECQWTITVLLINSISNTFAQLNKYLMLYVMFLLLPKIQIVHPNISSVSALRG